MKRFLGLILCLTLFACSEASNESNTNTNTQPVYPTADAMAASLAADILAIGEHPNINTSVDIINLTYDLNLYALSLCNGNILNPPVSPATGENGFGCVNNLTASVEQVGSELVITINIPVLEMGIDINSGAALVELTVQGLSFVVRVPVLDNADGTVTLDTNQALVVESFLWDNLSYVYTATDPALDQALAATQAILTPLATQVSPYLTQIVTPSADDLLVNFTTVQVP